MDFIDALKAGGASATILAIAGIGLKLLQTFCGHRLRSECCGREGTVGVAVEEMTPRGPRPSIEVKVVPHTQDLPADTTGQDKTEAKSLPASRKASPVFSVARANSEPLPPPLAI